MKVLLYLNVLALAVDYARAADGEVLVAFNRELTEQETRAVLDRCGLTLERRFQKGGAKANPRFHGLAGTGSLKTPELLSLLRQQPEVRVAEPNFQRVFSSVSETTDQSFSQQWALENTGQSVNGTTGVAGADIKWRTAMELSRELDDEIIIAVIDSGLDPAHPEFASSLWTHPGEIAGNGKDDDGNGYVDDVHGFDFSKNTGTMSDASEHGTHVSGIIGADANGRGTTGVFPGVAILPLKVSTNGSTLSGSAIIAAMDYLVDLKKAGHNIVAVNASFGSTGSSILEQEAIQALADSDIILCAAAGNESSNNDSTPSYPASYDLDNIISVAAHTPSNKLAGYSNFGATSVDLSAPGSEIYSTIPLAGAATEISVKYGNVSAAAAALEYSQTTGSTGLAGTLYDCGIGNEGEFPDGVRGNIALIRRGSLNFSTKVTNAIDAGAIGAIIYDNTSQAITQGSWTLGEEGDWIPVVRISQADGETLLEKGSILVTLSNWTNFSTAYDYFSGTSMATPHVTAAVALTALNHPGEPVPTRIGRILDNVTPIPSLAGKTVTGGLLNLSRMLDTEEDGLPDWWEQEAFGSLAETGQGDNDGDGFTNRLEQLLGTSPTDAREHFRLQGMSSMTSIVSFSFPTVPGVIYHIERSFTMRADDWLPMALISDAEVAIETFTDDASTDGAAFYRVRLEEEE